MAFCGLYGCLNLPAEDFANDVEEYLQKREEQDPHIQRHKRDTSELFC